MSHGRFFASCLLLTLTPFARKKNTATPSGTPGGSWSSSNSSWISSRTVARVERVEISTVPTAGSSGDRKISSSRVAGCLLWTGDGGGSMAGCVTCNRGARIKSCQLRAEGDSVQEDEERGAGAPGQEMAGRGPPLAASP